LKPFISFLFIVFLVQSSVLGAKEGAQEALVRAEEALEEGLNAEAEESLQTIASPSVWDFWKSVLLARAKLNQDEPQEALNRLKDVLGPIPPPPVDLMNKNQTFYRRLYKKALETGIAASARLSKPREDWARRLWALFPDFEAPIASAVPAGFHVSIEDKTTRLHILFEKSLFETIPKILTSSEIGGAALRPPDKCRALFEWGSALQKLGRKEEAVEALGWITPTACDGKILTRALYWKGLMESELRHYDAAEAAFRLLAKHSADGRYTDDAYYRLYRMFQSQNQDDKAAHALQHLSELPEGDMKEKYLWDEAFAAYQDKDYEKALDLLDRIVSTRSIGTEAQPQALYWKARIAEILSKKKLGGSSAAAYSKVIKSYPFSFYAVLAEGRLGKPPATPSIAKQKTSFPSDRSTADAFREVDELNRKEDHEAASDVLDYLTHLHPEIAKERPELIAQRWMESGDSNRALEMATESLDKSVFDINLKKDDPLTRALYPLAYPKDVKLASETNRLPQGLIEAIMREESLFLRGVRSHAGAVGLMQLMPATARIKAHRLGVPLSSGGLGVPSSNILLGTSFLRDMMDFFRDQTALAVMAYNAGPRNVSRWMASQGDLPLDEFIESIPFTETRGYVKRVLRSEHIYGILLGDRKATRPIQSLDAPQ